MIVHSIHIKYLNSLIMLQVTPEVLNLNSHQKRYNVKVINHSKQSVVFKIVSTSWKFFKVQPNLGKLQPNSQLSLLLTMQKRKYFKEKIQILYDRSTKVHQDPKKYWQKIQNPLKQIIIVSFGQQNLNQDDSNIQMPVARSKSQDKIPKKSTKKNNHRPSIQIKNSALTPIKQQNELKYLFSKMKKTGSSSSLNKALKHLEKQRKKHIDQEQREELLFEIEELERKYQLQHGRSQRLSQQLEIAEKKLQNNSVQILKFQIGHSLGVVCQQYHTSFAGLTILALTFFVIGYVLASL